MNAPMLELDAVTAGYRRGVPAIRSVSLEVKPGQMIGLFGANGSGKSTTLRSALGLCRVSHGRVRFESRDITRQATFKRIRQGLALVPQGHALFAGLTVSENLTLGAYAAKHRGPRQRMLDMILEVFPRLSERRTQLAGSLSGGERAMLSIGRGLMAQPSCLLLDEPSLGLSPLARRAVFGGLEQIVGDRSMSVILAEQDVVNALAIVDRAYVLRNGLVVFAAPSKDLTAQQLPELYLSADANGDVAPSSLPLVGEGHGASAPPSADLG